MSAHRVRWLIFLSCGALLGVALGWVTWAAIDLERKGHEQRVANLELELEHLAMARMDSALTTVLAKEAARPWSHYRAFYTPEPAITEAGRAVDTSPYLQTSPLLRDEPTWSFFRLYFSMWPDGDSLTSPQLPTTEDRDRALEQGLTTESELARQGRALRRLDEMVTREELFESIERQRPQRRSPTHILADENIEPLALIDLADDPEQRVRRADAELRWRNRLMLYAYSSSVEAGGARVSQRAFVPYLVPGTEEAPELLFIRDLRLDELKAVQGIWIDWPELSRFLLGEIRDLYPAAKLNPVSKQSSQTRLVSIPFAFDPGPRREYPLETLTPTRLALLGLWTALLAAAIAVGLMLQKTLELSERRRSFVSAVTHELRTPLTTFCMYSEMLADGIVKDEAAQREYFATLKEESVRLRRIVENVLGYARLEGRKNKQELEGISAEALLDRILPALERRTAEAGMELVPDLRLRPDCRVEVDAQTIEQVLFNLVDNACKYAAAGEPSVHLEAHATRDEVIFSVLDHGPGIPKEVKAEIFRPFKRAAGDAEGVIPGIGLGLSLARGMSRTMGGDVCLTAREGFGAVFELHLPQRSG